tara:strand:+ start:425 stop:730 length:306 start_codon:yes stop_codon:yes gene_type:complete
MELQFDADCQHEYDRCEEVLIRTEKEIKELEVAEDIPVDDFDKVWSTFKRLRSSDEYTGYVSDWNIDKIKTNLNKALSNESDEFITQVYSYFEGEYFQTIA